MLNISVKKRISVSEELLREVCLDAINDFMCDEYNIAFVYDVPSDNRKLIYAKVGAALIDFAESEVIV